jgi:tellurite resistance protein TerC
MSFHKLILWVLLLVFKIAEASLLAVSSGYVLNSRDDLSVATAHVQPTASFIDSIASRLEYSSEQSVLESKAVLQIGRKELLQLSNDPHNKDMKMFHYKDIWHWVIFTVVFFILIIFDNVVLHRGNQTISFPKACCYTVFWIFLAMLFCVYIYFIRGIADAFQWGVGYTLEWMLSVDNLFVFHLVFKLYGTPDHLKHKPLFYGIVGAVVFRMIFFVVEGTLLSHLWWMHFVFGIFLIYTGIKSAMVDDDDEDPRDNWCVKCLANRLPLINGYDNGGNFFVRVPIDENGEPIMPDLVVRSARGEKEGYDEEKTNIYQANQWYSTPRAADRSPDLSDSPSVQRRSPDSCGCAAGYEWRATTLLLVVLCLEATDIIFAVDSVSAIIAEIPDLYLAYTACVFAMLGLRAMFFVIERMIVLFEYLKYGVAAILVFIGVKLMARSWIHVPPWLVLIILVGTLVTCVLASVIKQKCCPKPVDSDD